MVQAVRGRLWAASASAAVLVLSGCGSDSSGAAPASSTVEPDELPTLTSEPTRCVVSLHGKGGDGAPSFTSGGVELLAPRGNDEAWNGWQWKYADDADYADAVAIVSNSIVAADCSAVAIHGFSNGAAFAAKLFCRAEVFGATLVGIVIDDPVTDAATAGCAPDPAVEATLYWTGALDADAPAGSACGPIDWTCDGDIVVGIDAFAAAADLSVTPSPLTEHRRFDDAPDPLSWLATADG